MLLHDLAFSELIQMLTVSKDLSVSFLGLVQLECLHGGGQSATSPEGPPARVLPLPPLGALPA